MANNNNKLLVLATIVLSFAVSACNEAVMMGKGFQSPGASSSNESSGAGVGDIVMDNGNVDMSKLDTELDTLEADLSKLDSKLKGLSVLSLTQSSSNQNSLGKDIKGFFTKLLSSVQKVKDRVNELKAQIEARLGQLDPSNPVHAQIIKKLDQAMAYLEGLQDKVASAVNGVLGIADGAISKVDQAIAKMDSKNPLTWLASAAWAAVKTVILEYRDKLALAIKI